MTTDQNPDLRAQLLDALDFAYCQGLGYDTPEALLDAYDVSRGVPVPPPADQTARRTAVAEALRYWVHPTDRETAADAVLAVLPEQTDRAAEAERPLSPDYEHPECGFHWHGRDGMDIPIRDGQPVCPRCELAKVEKKLAYVQRMREEVGAECKRRGKTVLEHSEKNRALERQLDEVRRQLGAEILRTNHAETELRRVAAEEQPAETQPTDRAGIIAELLPVWEAVYEPGNVSDYLIGYANDQDAATGMAEAWMRSQAEVAGRLEWTPWGTATAMPDGYDAWFELVERHDDGIDTGPGIIVRRRIEPAVGEQPETQETLPPPEGPEYTPCICDHIEPEHEPDAGACWSCDCESYRPTPPAPLLRSEDACPGFPERCPNLRTVDPSPPTHFGGIRCGCSDPEGPE